MTNTGEQPTTICLVRHGETDWNLNRRYQGQSDVPLNDTGREQASLAAAAIAAEPWHAIVSSPLERAMATARAIADASGIDTVDEDADLVERSYGAAEGMTLEEREATWPDGSWPGLEPWADVAERAVAAIERIAAAHPGERVLVVCHGGTINAILAVLSDNQIGTGKTVITNTSRTTLTRDADGWTIGDVNVADHLYAEAANA